MFGYKKKFDSMKSKWYSIEFFTLEILLIFLWSKLKYYALLTISRSQDFSWYCSIELDCDPHEHVDSENLSETFIGKTIFRRFNLKSNEKNIIRLINKSTLILGTNVQFLQIRLHQYICFHVLLLFQRWSSYSWIFIQKS